MENRDALLVIAGSLFLFDELVEFRIVVVDALGTAAAKVLIEIDIGVAAVAAGVGVRIYP